MNEFGNGAKESLTAEEARRLLDRLRLEEHYGVVEFKLEAGKITRVKMEHNMLPQDVREYSRS